MSGDRQRRQERIRREAEWAAAAADDDDEGEVLELVPVEAVQDVKMEIVESGGPAAPRAKEFELPKRSATGILAWIMDEVIPIPGTKLTIGLDPIMAILPLGGALAASALSCVALLEAMRRGLPIRAIWQIIGNILLNAGIGTIPVIGDIFTVVFRSNSRNRDVIKQHLREAIEQDRKPSWGPIILTIGFILTIIAAAIAANLFLWGLIGALIGKGLTGMLS